VSSTKVPIYGPAGKIIGLVGVSRDLTAFKQAELGRQMMELQLRQSQKLESIGQLAAGIAHEINTPTQYVGDNTRFVKDSFENILKVLQIHKELLAAVKQNAITPELVLRNEEILVASDLDYLCEQIPSALKETLEGVERVGKIVRAMKEFSHPGGKEKTSADLNRAIESTVTVARNEWKYVAEVKLELEPNLPLVSCFLGEFNQCILNLIVNAAHAIGDVVKANPSTKGLIIVQTRHDGGEHVEVRVTDTGTGIPEAVRPKIFEPFFTTKDVGKGTGQGLALIYGTITKRHGGTVTFETETGKGTTFILRLPIQPDAGTEAVPPQPLGIAPA
jgi:signal transduction histidine kinase